MGKRKRSSPATGKRGAGRGDGEEGACAAARPPPKGRGRSPATGKRGAGRRRRERGHSHRLSTAADGEEGTGPLPRGRGRSPATEKRALAHGEEAVGSDSTQYGGVGLCIGIGPFQL